MIRPGGLCSHVVDLKDHLGGALNNLRFSQRVWESRTMAGSGVVFSAAAPIATPRPRSTTSSSADASSGCPLIATDGFEYYVGVMILIPHKLRAGPGERWVYPGFPTLFWGLSGFFVDDLMGKALWKLVENAQRFPRCGGRVLCVHGRRQLPQGPSVCDKIAASSDCSRPVNDYVHIEAADLCRPNARFTQERQGYQVLTPFGKLGYSQKGGRLDTRNGPRWRAREQSGHSSSSAKW